MPPPCCGASPLDTCSKGPPPSRSFDRVAAEYEATRFLPPVVADALARRVSAVVDARDWFLDAGVGTGRIGRALARRHARTVGADIAPVMLAQLLRHGRAEGTIVPHLVRADLRNLPFADATFAGVLAVHVFHLIVDWEHALAELWRVLRPGGALFFAVEERQPTQVREFFLQRAREAGVLPAHGGAHVRDVSAALEAKGVRVLEAHGPDLAWRETIAVDETLARLARRSYSQLWDMSDAAHAVLLDETREWVLRRFGRLPFSEQVETRMILFTARKNNGAVPFEAAPSC